MAGRDQTLDAFLYNGCVDRDVKRFARDLSDADPPSVDSFLEHRRDFLKIGKLAICLSLIPKEQDWFLSRLYRNDHPGRGVWYHYLWNEMAAPKGGFGSNNVSFVTLNYDWSLERYLFLRLKAKHQYSSDEECLDELYGLRFVHLYGSLGDERFAEDPFDRREPSPQEVLRAADRLRIIHEEAREAQYVPQAVSLLKQAEVICFLGCGFHALNNERLGLAAMANDGTFRDQKWFSSRYGLTEVEFRRKTQGFRQKFFAFESRSFGDEADGALEVLWKQPVI